MRRPPDRRGRSRRRSRARSSDRTRLVWIESPTNPRLLVYDIAAIAAAAHARGALVVVDNTFATPLFQQPFQLGADIVVHSVTKYLAGHSDLIQGAVLAKDASVFEPIKFLQNATGAVPSPFDCWLTLRGLEDAGAARASPRGERGSDRRSAQRTSRGPSRLLSRPPRSSRARDRAEADDGFRRHGLVRARRIGRRRRVLRVVAAVLRARREPRRRQGARLPPGAHDPRVDSGAANAQSSGSRTRSCGCRPAASITRTWSPTCSRVSRRSTAPRERAGRARRLTRRRRDRPGSAMIGGRRALDASRRPSIPCSSRPSPSHA